MGPGRWGNSCRVGSVDVGRVTVAVFGADIVGVNRSAQAVTRASCSEKTHTMGAATLWWVIVLLSSRTMSMLISCRMMSETT